MKLQYRGISYESHPHNITLVTTGITAKFRGFIYHIQKPFKTYLHSVNILKYRGRNYIKNNQITSLPNSEFYQQSDINSVFHNYSIHEDVKKFMNDLNKFY